MKLLPNGGEMAAASAQSEELGFAPKAELSGAISGGWVAAACDEHLRYHRRKPKAFKLCKEQCLERPL